MLNAKSRPKYAVWFTMGILIIVDILFVFNLFIYASTPPAMFHKQRVCSFKNKEIKYFL